MELELNAAVNHLASVSIAELPPRSRSILGYLANPLAREEESLPGFIQQMHRPPPYRSWCKEATDVTKEVFWIFLHHSNAVPQAPPADPDPSSDAYVTRNFPREHPAVPAAAWVGGVEWDATNYLATHLDLLNALLASLPSRTERNALRGDLQHSGFEKLLGGTLRLCKEKFYGVVHDGLRTWVAAADEDGWDTAFVRLGPIYAEHAEPRGSPRKEGSLLPRLELPALDLGCIGQASSAEGEWV